MSKNASWRCSRSPGRWPASTSRPNRPGPASSATPSVTRRTPRWRPGVFPPLEDPACVLACVDGGGKFVFMDKDEKRASDREPGLRRSEEASRRPGDADRRAQGRHHHRSRRSSWRRKSVMSQDGRDRAGGSSRAPRSPSTAFCAGAAGVPQPARPSGDRLLHGAARRRGVGAERAASQRAPCASRSTRDSGYLPAVLAGAPRAEGIADRGLLADQLSGGQDQRAEPARRFFSTTASPSAGCAAD